MELETILFIVSGVLTVVATLFGAKTELVKKKLGEVKTVMKEAVDVFTVSTDALGDNKITTEEAAAIKKETQEMIGAFKLLIGKG